MPPNNKSKSEIHLFIIWENARYVEEKILEDISQKFKILRVFEVSWSKDKFGENLSRFYGTLLAPNSKKENHVGVNPFLAVIVEDKKPVYKTHTTSRGDKHVNSNLFTSKAKHRDWTGGGHRIHATNTTAEADHDLTLLFGKNSTDLLDSTKEHEPNKPIPWKNDVIGSNGWDNLRQLFYVLNNTIEYVVLRNFDQLPDKFYAKDHGDIDLLVPSYGDISLITKSKPVHKNNDRVYNTVLVNGSDVLFDFRHVGDGYYDISWEQAILSNRVLSKKGFFVPAPTDYFYSLLYHCIIHKPATGDDYIKRLVGLAPTINQKLSEESFKNGDSVRLLSKFLIKNSYKFTQPNDKSVYFHMDNIKLGMKAGARFTKNNRVPMRNYLKKRKAMLKHYALKSRRLVRGYFKKIKT